MSSPTKIVNGVPTGTALVSGDIPNNAANTSGTSNNVTGTVAPGNGGTGDTTYTAYGLLAAGTTSTGIFQQISQAGLSAGMVLTWNNSSSLPTFQTPSASSPLTTKGDLFTFSTANARLPAGLDYQSLINDANQTTGNRWATNYKGPKNYIQYNDFENGATTGWSLGTVGTLTNGIPTGSPTFGSGASGNLSIAAATSSPLSGTTSLSYVSSAATTQGNMLASSSYAIDIEDQAKVLTFRFYYQAFSGAANDNFSGTSSNSFGIAVYDVTNSVWLSSTANFAMTQNSGAGIATGTVQTGSSTANLRFVIYNANATAGATTIYFDDFFLGPQTAPIGAPITDWVAYTPTIVGFGTPTNVNFFSRRVGGNLEVQGYFTTGTSTAVTASVTVGFAGANANVNVNSALLPNGSSNTNLVGQLALTGTSGSVYNVITPANPTTTLQFSQGSGSTNGLTAATGSAITSSGSLSFLAKVPIVGWQSNVQMSNDTDTRVVSASAHVSSGVSTTTPNPFNFDTVDWDTHGAITTGASTWKYTVPVSGYYKIAVAMYLGAVNGNFLLYKNGSIYRTIGTNISSSFGATGNTTEVPCNSGDTLYIANTSTGTPTIVSGATIAQAAWITIDRISGPSVIAATESVNAAYGLNANVAVAANGTIIWNNKQFDSHNAMNTSTGVYTVPVSGKYSISYIGDNSTAGASIILNKNGSNLVYIASQPGVSVLGSGTVVINCNSGDTLNLSLASAVTLLSGTPLSNYISISRIGN